MSTTRLQPAVPARVERPARAPVARHDTSARERNPARSARHEELLLLQRQVGNAAVAQLLRGDEDQEVQDEPEVHEPQLELVENETDVGPPDDDDGGDAEAPPNDSSADASAAAAAAEPTPSAPNDAPTPPPTAASAGPPADSFPTDESSLEQAVAARAPEREEPAPESSGAELPVIDDAQTDQSGQMSQMPSLAGLRQQETAAFGTIATSEQAVQTRTSALAGQINGAIGAAKRTLVKAYASTLATLAGLRQTARTDALLTGLEAQAELDRRRKRQKALNGLSKINAAITLNGRLGGSRGQVDEYERSRLQSSAQQTADQRRKLKQIRNRVTSGYAGSSKPKQVRRLAEKAYSRLLGQSLDATVKARNDLRKKTKELRTEIDNVRIESYAQFMEAGAKVDEGIDGLGNDPGRGLIAGSAPFYANGIAEQGEVDKVTQAAADQGMKSGLMPALAELDELRRQSLAAVAPVRRTARGMFGALRAGVRSRFALIASIVAGVRGRRATSRALQAATDFGAQIIAGAGRGARSVADRVRGWADRLVDAPSEVVENVDFDPLVEATKTMLSTHLSGVRERNNTALDDLESQMGTLVAEGAAGMAKVAETAGDSTTAKVSEQLGELEQKFQPAIDGLDRVADGFQPRLSKAAMALWDAWYEKAWSYLKGALGGLLKAMWNFIEGLLLVILAVVAIVVAIIVIAVVVFKMTIAAAIAAVAAVAAAVIASVVVAVILTGLAVYGAYKAITGGYDRWKKVTDDPLSTREEVGSAVGEGAGDVAAEFIPLKVPKPLARFSNKVANRFRKPKMLPEGGSATPAGRGSDAANKVDEVDEAGSGAGRADELDDARKADEADSAAGKADELDEAGTAAGKADELDAGARKLDDLEDAAPTPRPDTPTRADAPESSTRGGAADDIAPTPKPGDSLTDEMLEVHFGIPATKARQFHEVAAQGNVKIWARPSTPHAPARMAEGAIPKIEAVKAKTINEDDLFLYSFGKGDLGKVGYFDPKLPVRSDMNAATWARVKNRHKFRQDEYKAFKEEMEYLAKSPHDPNVAGSGRGPKPDKMSREPGNDQITVENGIVKAIDQETGAKQVLTGDVDAYQIGKADGSEFATSGKPGDPDFRDEFETLRDRMVEAELLEHDAHLRWLTRGDKEEGIKQIIIKKHAEGEHIIEFGPGGAKLVKASEVPGHNAALAEAAKPKTTTDGSE